MQRSLAFAIVDEVDSILIDEARTPLIISGPAEESTELYLRINKLVPQLTRQQQEDAPGDFAVDEKSKQVHLTEAGPRARRAADGCRRVCCARARACTTRPTSA